MKRSTFSAPGAGQSGWQSRGGPVQRVRLGGRFTPGGLFILGIYAFSYLLLQLPVVGDYFADRFLLQPALALGTRPYQLLTAPLFMTSLLSLGFLALLLWGVGSAVEQKLGTRRFLLWAGLTSLVASLAAAAVGHLFPGAHLVPLDNLALFPFVLLSFAQFYGEMRVTIWGLGPAVSGRALSYFFVGLGLGADLLARQWPQLAAASAAVVGTLLLGHGSAGLWAAVKQRWQRWRRSSHHASPRHPYDVDERAAPPGSQAGAQSWLN